MINKNRIIKYRRDLHKCVEIGENLYETKKYLLNIIKTWNCSYKILSSSIIVFFDFKQSYSIAFRSDMDGLALEEKNEVDYRAKKNMHACGHDGHMAMLLELGNKINELNKLDKNIVLIFEEAEELGIGAGKIINAKILEKYDIKAIFAYHLWPGLAYNKIYSKPLEMMACSSEVEIEAFGVSSHIKEYKKAVDSIFFLSKFLVDLDKYNSKNLIIKFGTFKGGKALNIVSDYAKITGSIRSITINNLILTFINIHRLKALYEKKYKIKLKVIFKNLNLGVKNSLELYNKVKKIIKINELNKISFAAETFGNYKKISSVLFMFLGIGKKAKGLHTPNFNFKEKVLLTGVKNYLDIVFFYK